MEGQELPVGWETYCLDELGGTKGGKTPSKSRPEFWEPGTINWTSPKDMKVFDLNGAEDQISDLAITEGGMEVLSAGSVLMVTRSGILSHTFPVAVANSETSINQDIKAVRPVAGLDERFLAYSLKSLERVVLQACSKEGTTVASVETKLLERLPLPLAPLDEQRRIAAKLDTTVVAVDACRQRLDGVAAILKRFRQAVLAAATSGELTREWREERDISQEAWKSIKTKDAGKIQLGRQRSPKYHQGPTMRPYLRVQNVFEDRIDLDDVMEMDFSGADLEKYALHPGDILLNEGQSPQYLGRPSMYRGELPGVCFTNSLIRFQASDSVLSEFALLVFRDSMHSGRYVEKGTITTNIAHLSAGRFGEVDFPLPPLAEQQEIVRRAQKLFTLAEQLEARLTAARKVVDRLTPALLAKAFRGELVPQDPNDEPASVLLERIRAARQAEAGAGKPSRRGRPKAAANPDQLPLDAAPVPSDPLPPDLLTQLLQECGALSERALLAASELEPEGFFTQLARELRLGSIRQSREEGQVLLEAVS